MLNQFQIRELCYCHICDICYTAQWQRMLVMRIGRIIMAMEMATDIFLMGSHTIRFIKINQSWQPTTQIHFFHPIALIVFSYPDYRKRFKKTKLFQYFQKLGRSSSPNMVRLARGASSLYCPVRNFSSNIFRNPENILIPGPGNEDTDRRRDSYLWIIWERKKCNRQVRSDGFQWTWNHISEASLARPKESLCRKVGEFIWPRCVRQVFGKFSKHVFIKKYSSVDSAKRIWLGIHMNYDEIFKLRRGFNIHSFSLFQILLDVFLPLTLVWATVLLQKLLPLI